MLKQIVLFLLLACTPGFSQIHNLDSLNSAGDELNPVFSPDGQTVYFIRRFDSANTGGMRDPGDIWTSTFASGAWNNPRKISGPLNNKQFNGLIALLSDKTVYLYEHYQPGGNAARTQGISVANLTEQSVPARLPIKYFYNKSDHISISLSPDEMVMILSLESYGTEGAEDLYVSFRAGKGISEWSEPRNIGSRINTKFQEMTPYIAPDGKTLFFSSNGHGGFGGRDLFMAERLDDSWKNWSEPKNLGSAVNTEGVELYFQYIGETGKAVFTSTTNSDGHSDFRVIDLEELGLENELVPQVPSTKIESEQNSQGDPKRIIQENDEPAGEFSLEGYVLDKKGIRLEAKLEVLNQNWSQTIYANPKYEVTVPEGGVYEFIVSSEGYISKQEIMDLRTSEIKAWKHDFTLQKIEVGITVNLKNVLFVQGSTELLESSDVALDLVVQMLKDNPEMEIQLSGHTDNQGNERLNKILSQQRVDAVIAYLKSHGIDKSRMSGKGLGGSNPIASNESEQTRSQNRRVEFTIIAN